ncbi:hypothetical protein CYMTET_5536 [Cymbomonas tetramitiformis]|uniref:Uncharacterized protein n=1 Tax=Cymbomonas tetramitiformis TaxID=36881 RepID=A0AAE0GZB2_9CHLO|nr:hypothetical protein CYMTET_25106 [Cymbomonas tetramitiformis]KAK3286928.1 hypothetical protein CYMTET_5536 [Cymbomonas tetramitiformis]
MATTGKGPALEEFYSEDYGDSRLKYTKRAKGYPLERQHGVLDEQGHVRYTLLKNCTTLDGSNLDENGFPSDNYHITVGPLRAHPREAVELLNHIETVLRILHEEGENKKYHLQGKASQTEGGAGGALLHIVNNELKGKSINDLEADLLLVEGVESALKGHRLQGRAAVQSATWVKLVMVSEEAAQRIENKTEIFPGLENYEVQRVASVKEVDKQTETEVVVVDGGDDIDPEFEVEALTCAVGDYFKKALGAGTHLVPQLAVPTYPATNPKEVASYARYRQLYKGRLYTFIATEDAYQHLVPQVDSTAKIGVVHKGMYFFLRPSDYSRNGKGRRGRQTRATGITREDAVVQALETKLGTFADAVKAATSNRGEVSGDAESAIKDLGDQVKGLSEKVEKGFKDTVDNVKKVNASVDNVDKGVKQVIDLTSNVLTRLDKHLALADKQNR